MSSWDERNPGAREYLDSVELMRLWLDTDRGRLEAVIYHDPGYDGDEPYMGSVDAVGAGEERGPRRRGAPHLGELHGGVRCGGQVEGRG